MGHCVTQGKNLGPGSEDVSGISCMGVSRDGDASEGKHAGSVSSLVICRKTSVQIFKLLTATDSLLVSGSNGSFLLVLSSIYCHLWSSSCHHVLIC